MGILKFAQFATIEAKVAPARITRTAMLRDARRHQFDYTPRPGFLYIRSRAISSRTNDNFDTYPAEELRTSYRSFVGKPVFVNHNNEDPKRGRGIILDAVLHEHTAPDGSPDTWVEVLMEVDAVRFPRLAQAILDGDIDRTSMGCNVMSSECSYCGRVAVTPDQYCDHIATQKGRRLRRRAAMGGTESVLVHEICRGLSFFENSLLVDEPADPTAYFLGIDDSGMRMAQKVAAFDPSTRTGITWSGTHDIWAGADKPQSVIFQGPMYLTAAEAEAYAAQFPKSWGIRGGSISGAGEYTGYVDINQVNLTSNNANKGINETGLKRLRTILAGLAARGITPTYTTPYGNSYRSEAEFWAAIERYEAGHQAIKRVAAFKLAADDDIDELVRVAQEAQAEWTRQQLKANRNSAAYKNAFSSGTRDQQGVARCQVAEEQEGGHRGR